MTITTAVRAATPAVSVAARYAVPAQRLFDAWLDARLAERWLFATATAPSDSVELEPHVQGRYCFVEQGLPVPVAWRGTYEAIERPRRIAFTLELAGESPAVTRVHVEITEARDGCELRLIHEDVPPRRARALRERWTGMLYGLGALLGSATDPLPLQEPRG